MSTTAWPIMTEALDRLREVGDAVRPDQLDAPTPCSQWSVAQVLQHAAGDQVGWAAAMGVGDGPGYDPFSPSGVLDGTVEDLLSPAVDVAARAWAAVPPQRELVSTPLPQGRLPAGVAAGACALDAAVHAWDVAVATGQPNPLTAELAEHLLAAAREVVEPLRQWGAYAPALPDQPDDDHTVRLLRYLGRDPHWQP